MRILQPETAYIFVGGFFLAMSVLHFILFMYNRHRKANLIYSLGMGIAWVNFTFIPISTDPLHTETSDKINILLNTLSNGALLYFISYYVIAYLVIRFRNVVQLFGAYYVLGFVALLIFYQYNPVFETLNIVLKSSLYVLVAVSCVLGLIKKIPNFHLIVMATLMLVVTDFLMSDLFNIWGKGNYPVARLLIMLVGYTGPFIAYSTYLSKDLAITSKKLTEEHIMNERLSRAKYEQELVTRKLIEAQKIELEKNVEERTREISKQKREIETQADKIKEIDKVKSRFFANISHEFRTPLTLIQGPIKKLLAEATVPGHVRDLTIVHQNANRLLQLVNQLLDLTKLESGALSLKISKTELITTLKPVVDSFQSLAEVKLITFKFEYPAFAIPIFIDSEKVEKIINNLLSNAFKFTPAGGEVCVTIQEHKSNERFPDGFAEIIVKDSGIGIAKEHLPKIFNRFYQVDNSQTREYEGTGIGLAITKEFSELLHGEITVTSELGLGTIFTLQLPLGDDVNRPAQTDENTVAESEETIRSDEQLFEEIPAGTAKETILIIEDNMDLRYYIRDNMPGNYHIIDAADGDEGLSLAFEQIPDLVISDIMMPKKDGFEVSRMLKSDERTSHIPVILLTAKADIQDKLDGLNIGADDYITKPFDVNELIVRSRNLIETRKKLREKFAGKLAIKPSEINAQSVDDRFLQKIMAIAEENMGNSQFGVEKFSREAGMSVAQLYRKLHALTGYTPNDFMRHIRLLRAADMFKQKAGNVADIAYQVGFNNMSYFAKCFKVKFGASPSDYLKS